MKKITHILLIGLISMSLMVIGCGGKYSDVKKINEKYIDLVKDYIADLEGADNAKNVAKAINRFADGVEDIWPKMQKLAKKYPELKNKSNPPEELKETQKRAEKMGMKMGSSMMKIMPYMGDAEVQKAQKRLATIMMKK